MFVNGFFKRHSNSWALTTSEKEIALWMEKARTTADSIWPSEAPTHPNLRQNAQARGMRRSQGRVARWAAWQICRCREKEGMRKFSECPEIFRRFAHPLRKAIENFSNSNCKHISQPTAVCLWDCVSSIFCPTHNKNSCHNTNLPILTTCLYNLCLIIGPIISAFPFCCPT